ncbi:MAG: hypothetical protein ACI9TH_003912 [Kiritimatiellia bacterium]
MPTKRNSEEEAATRMQSRTIASNGLDRVRERSKADKTSAFSNLFHFLKVDLQDVAALAIVDLIVTHQGFSHDDDISFGSGVAPIVFLGRPAQSFGIGVRQLLEQDRIDGVEKGHGHHTLLIIHRGDKTGESPLANVPVMTFALTLRGECAALPVQPEFGVVASIFSTFQMCCCRA